MTALLEEAADRLNTLQRRRPDLVRLARVASLAVRVEPHLLRRLRLECAPEADVGSEADLWFSALVESRGTDAIVLDQHVGQLLREDVARRPDVLETAIAVTEEAHQHAPAALRLEERIIALAARHGDRAVAEINSALEPAVRSLKDSDVRGREIARWWMRAAPRLDPIVWRCENAVALLIASSVLLRRNVLPSAPVPPGALATLGWALPAGIPLDEIEAGVDLDGNRLTFREPADSSSSIRLPATKPPFVEVRWFAGGGQHKAVCEVEPGKFFEFPTQPVDVTLHTLRGAVFQVGIGPEPMQQLPTCFVVMPFGTKTDFASGRTLDLDKTYRHIIKPAAEEAGLTCTRADEVAHAGNINVPMFDRLLTADVVIADLSTLNVTTAYELGIRHALRPSGTIVIAETGARNPVDMVAGIISYKHLGEGIEYGEVGRMRDLLTKVIRERLAGREVDSPVYTFLPDLVPPEHGSRKAASDSAPSETPAQQQAPPVAALLEQAETHISRGEFGVARQLLASARSLTPDDDHVLRRLVLATYKDRSEQPEAALRKALTLLEELKPETSNDTETLGLHGAVLKRLWDATRDRTHLDGAIRSYERGFYLRNDHYNGVNLAFMLNVRASISPAPDAVADFVQAQRVRREVLEICERTLRETPPKERADRYWLLATMAECAVGLSDRRRADELIATANADAPADWMRESTADQLRRLEALIQDSPLRLLRSEMA
jgi:hypothetical protein